MRARLIFLIRLLKIDTIFSYDPWGHYEENPDHYVTAQCVEAACWMAGGHLDFPEHFAAGLKPHSVSEKYYYARGPQLVNRVVDISSTIDKKMAAIRANRTMIGNMVRRVSRRAGQAQAEAAGAGRRPDARDPRVCRSAVSRRPPAAASEYGLDYAEQFHYIGPDTSLDEYIAKHAVPLK